MKNFYWFLLVIWTSTCSKTLHVTSVPQANFKIAEASTVEPSSEIEAIIAPYKNQLEEEMNEVIGTCAQDLTKAKPECSLGNFMADLVHKKCEAYYENPIDFALVNYGGIRIPTLAAGEISRSDIFELMPFENMLVVIHVDAATLTLLFDRMADYGGWPVSYQVRYGIKNRKPVDVTISGKPIEAGKMYKIALTDFVANGGDKCYFFKDKKRYKLGKLFRDVIIEHVQDLTKIGDSVDAKLEGRVVVVED
ncbi:MAG: 5'-nucleotidase C-terminal domain-containing protein [Bacteroidota bacterium]